MPDFGIFRGFNDKLFGDKLYAGQLPTQLGLIGSEDFGFVGLLDTYPNAAAAYSLRKLRIGYTGDAIEVRIDTTGQPTYDIGFVDGELDVTTLEGYCTGGLDAYVTTWYDQSGNGNDATQTTASGQPQIVSSGSVIEENGKPSVQFDGADDYLLCNLYGQNRLDKFLVQNISDTQFVNFNNGFSGGGTYGYTGLQGQTNTTIYSNYGTPTLYINNLQQNPSTRDDIYTLLNGYSLQSIINSSTFTWTAFSINGYSNGSSINTQGKMQEFITYPSDQSSNRTGIETNINDFYSIY